MARSHCLAAWQIRIARRNWNRTSAAQNKTSLKGLRFESLEEAQAYLERWKERWADTRIHSTMKRQVAATFAEDRPALCLCCLSRLVITNTMKRTVHLDGCVEVEALTAVHRRAGTAAASGTVERLACPADPSTQWPITARAPPSTARDAIASRKKIALRGLRSRPVAASTS